MKKKTLKWYYYAEANSIISCTIARQGQQRYFIVSTGKEMH